MFCQIIVISKVQFLFSFRCYFICWSLFWWREWSYILWLHWLPRHRAKSDSVYFQHWSFLHSFWRCWSSLPYRTYVIIVLIIIIIIIFRHLLLYPDIFIVISRHIYYYILNNYHRTIWFQANVIPKEISGLSMAHIRMKVDWRCVSMEYGALWVTPYLMISVLQYYVWK